MDESYTQRFGGIGSRFAVVKRNFEDMIQVGKNDFPQDDTVCKNRWKNIVGWQVHDI